MTAARLLHRGHELVVYEANDRIGGHSNTVDVQVGDESHAIDTGFIVFNTLNYPNFSRMLDRLGVESIESSMSFSVRVDRTGLEYNGTRLGTVFAQRRNLASPRFLGMLRDILRFHRDGPAWLAEQESLGRIDDGLSVSAFIERYRYGRLFTEAYLVPMGASIWSCPPDRFGRFPIRFVLEFMRHHRMLQVEDRPLWRTVRGGSRSYVEQLVAPFRDAIRLGTPVRRVRRIEGDAHGGPGVLVETDAEAPERFDDVIIAAHADQALSMLDAPTDLERSLLQEFPFQLNDAILHTDASVLPRSRRAWAAWNYRVPAEAAAASEPARVTYLMNDLQSITSAHSFCVTLNDRECIDPSTVLGEFRYAHPLYTPQRAAAQAQHADVIRHRGISYCGAYWGFGFHEDGASSGIRVAEAFGRDLTELDAPASPIVETLVTTGSGA